MSYEPIALFVPVVYAALQYDAVYRMQNSWKSAAYLPAGLMCLAFGLQVLLSIASPSAAAWVPLAAMSLACVYLAALNLLHDRMIRQAMEADARPLSRNVINLDDYRAQS